MHYQTQINVEVHDVAELRDFALCRALEAKISVDEFEHYEKLEGTDKSAFYLSWAFDNGTPEGCGFSIDSSETVFTGE